MASRTTTESKKSTTSKSASRSKRKGELIEQRAAARALAKWRKGGEITGLVLLALSVGLCLALVSSDPADIEAGGQVGNWIGPLGAYAADILLYIFGIGAFFVVAVIFLLGGIMLVGHRPELKPSEFVGQAIFVLSGAIFAHLFFKGETLFGHKAGGLVGELIGGMSTGLIGEVGSYLLAVSMGLLALMLVTDMSLGGMVQWVGRQIGLKISSSVHQYQTQRALRRRLREELDEAQMDEGDGDGGWFLDDDALEERVNAQLKVERKKLRGRRKARYQDEEQEQEASSKRKRRSRRRRQSERAEEADAQVEDPAEATPSVPVVQRRPGGRPEDKPEPLKTGVFELGDTLANLESEPEFIIGEPEAKAPAGGVSTSSSGSSGESKGSEGSSGAGSTGAPVVTREAREAVAELAAPAGSPDVSQETMGVSESSGDIGPQIVESEAVKQARLKREALSKKEPVSLKKPDPGEFALPHLSFLDYDNPDEVVVNKDMLRQMAMQLEKTLGDFGVEGKIVEICPGPVITMFEFSPAPGVKLSKIANLSDDLAMALAAISVRIIAPIPGKGVVGIEVPNPSREMVFLKEIVADETFQGSRARMPMALGKNTEGGPVVADLASMPHLLVAGATGSGKSVAVNTMIVSLLFRYTPNDVRLIMVDPKMLEFSIYEGIPHLLLPVVTDPKQAAVALNWAVNEMERRYQQLADMGVRNIVNYNQRVQKLTAQCEEDLKAGRTSSDAVKKLQLDGDGNPNHVRLPYIVVIIDEFADLMMVAGKDVEQCVARLAQKARAAGIHLILATQRPSVDVITGLIKANFPTRIALRVAQKTDSRTILDANGAENLLGKGDMLFLPPGTSQQQRVHGAFVSENEIERIVDFLKEQGTPQYDESILSASEDDGEDGETRANAEEYDEHYDEAVYIVTSERKASISMIQRKLRVGYNRAARMIERMEEDGIVGPSDGSRPRDVLAPPPV